jgi:hypothetical protein
MTTEDIRRIVEATSERMAYLTSGGRERITIDSNLYITLLWETWFVWTNGEAWPTNGYVVSESDNEQIQHRFQTLSEADGFIDQLTTKYAQRMALHALGIR